MRFVPIRTAEQQAALTPVGLPRSAYPQSHAAVQRHPRLRRRVRVHCAPKVANVRPLLERIQADEGVPDLARELFAAQAEEYAQLEEQIAEISGILMAWHKADECSRRPRQDPRHRPDRRGVADDEDPSAGAIPIGAPVRSLDRIDARGTIQQPARSSSASSRGAGDEALRAVLVSGATAVIGHAVWLQGTRVALAHRPSQAQAA